MRRPSSPSLVATAAAHGSNVPSAGSLAFAKDEDLFSPSIPPGHAAPLSAVPHESAAAASIRLPMVPHPVPLHQHQGQGSRLGRISSVPLSLASAAAKTPRVDHRLNQKYL